MPSDVKSNLTIKYGDKTSDSTAVNPILTVPTGEVASSESAGNIYAAKNSTGEIEIYIDTPLDQYHNTTSRKRLDPRIFVGNLDDVDMPADLGDNPTNNEIEVAKTNSIWENYDVWIDTSGDPIGLATTISNGLMSSTNVSDIMNLKSNMTTAQTNISNAQTDINNIKTKINSLIDALQGLNIQIVKGPWDAATMNVANTLSIVMPASWSGSTITFNPDGGVTKFGGSGSS